MAKFKIYKIHFTSPLHISDQREDASNSQKSIHSDTLHAALIACLAKAGHPIPVEGNLGCIISDMFPYYQKDKDSDPIYFLPMPLRATLPELADPADIKKVKKVRWVDSRLFDALLGGQKFFSAGSNDIGLIQASYMTRFKLPEDSTGSKEFVCSEVMQRVSIKDRSGHDPAIPYYVDRISFRDESGLYFLAYGDDTSLLDEALRILKMEGMGTDRYVGYGFFEPISKDKDGNQLEMEIKTPEDADFQVALSLLIPESSEQLHKLIASDQAAYDFTRRGGWITSEPWTTFRKNAVYAFLPGSVFCKTDGKICVGKMIDLKPTYEGCSVNHPIWRNGQSIMLPIKIN